MKTRSKTAEALKLKSVSGKTPAVKSLKFKFGLFKKNLQRGETKIHKLVMSQCTRNEFEAYLNYLGKDKATRLAKTADDLGRLPVDFIPFYETEKHPVANVLKAYTIADTLSPIHQPIDEQAVLEQYRVLKHSVLAKRLQLACQAANSIRELKLRSNTHPSVNALSADEVDQRRSMIIHLRNQRFFSSPAVAQKLSYPQKRLKGLQEKNRPFVSAKVGNCMEYADLAIAELRELDHEVRLEEISFANGDHVFVVIGRNKASDINDVTTWGSHAVVCDAWSGGVYPAYDLPVRLMDYQASYFKGDNRAYATVFHYNPRYHQLEVDLELPPFSAKASRECSQLF